MVIHHGVAGEVTVAKARFKPGQYLEVEIVALGVLQCRECKGERAVVAHASAGHFEEAHFAPGVVD